MLKKWMALAFLSTMLVGFSYTSSVAFAEEEEAAEVVENTEEAAPQEEKKVENHAVLYLDPEYGFSILCPARPHVVPAEVMFEGKKGKVLIFDNDGYDIKLAWVVTVDAFDDKAVPDLNHLSDAEAKSYLEKLQKSNGYEGIGLMDLTKENKAIFAITGREVEIDTNGDGVADMTATADTQEAVAFFRGDKGGRYMVQLIDNPKLEDRKISDFQFALSSFREIEPQILEQYKKALAEKEAEREKLRKERQSKEK